MFASPVAPTLQAARVYRANHAPNSEESLVERYLPLVKSTVDRMRIYLTTTVDLDDLYSVGVTGLLAAVKKYDPAQSESFPAFAAMHIRGSVHDELRRMDWMPRSLRDKAKRFKDAVSALEQRLGRPAEEGEVCTELALSADEYESLIDEIKPATFVPLDGTAYKIGRAHV